VVATVPPWVPGSLPHPLELGFTGQSSHQDLGCWDCRDRIRVVINEVGKIGRRGNAVSPVPEDARQPVVTGVRPQPLLDERSPIRPKCWRTRSRRPQCGPEMDSGFGLRTLASAVPNVVLAAGVGERCAVAAVVPRIRPLTSRGCMPLGVGEGGGGTSLAIPSLTTVGGVGPAIKSSHRSVARKYDSG
jgi:hypothetical protein